MVSRKGKLYGQLYPWSQWFAQNRFTAVRGKDYRCQTNSFIQQVRNAARLHHVSVSVDEADDGTVTVTVTPRRLADEEADQDRADDEVNYVPQGGDRREVVERQIRKRRGRRQFRDALRERYRDRCLVTGCEVLAVLEAAHISPYRGEDDNHPANGLLLRADIHTLFDLDLLGIEPEGLRVELHPDVLKEYGCFAGVTLRCPGEQRPAREALSLRYEQFRRRLHRPP
jgi:hypothetical protein